MLLYVYFQEKDFRVFRGVEVLVGNFVRGFIGIRRMFGIVKERGLVGLKEIFTVIVIDVRSLVKFLSYTELLFKTLS